MKDISCHVIYDLIPLVKDQVASRESQNIVMGHIESCEACRKQFDMFESMGPVDSYPEDKRIINSIRRRLFITQMTILTLGAIVGVALTGSMGQFYNFIIMPIVGGFSIIVLKDRWHMGFIAVFVLSYLGQVIYFIFTNQFSWGVLYGATFYGMIYISLMALGVVIWRLLRFAFGKEGGQYERE